MPHTFPVPTLSSPACQSKETLASLAIQCVAWAISFFARLYAWLALHACIPCIHYAVRRLTTTMNHRFTSERQLGQKALDHSSQAYDKQLLSKIGGPNTPTRTAAPPLSSSAQDPPADVHAHKLNGRQLKPLSVLHPDSPPPSGHSLAQYLLDTLGFAVLSSTERMHRGHVTVASRRQARWTRACPNIAAVTTTAYFQIRILAWRRMECAT